jgi:hypothetical protein
VEIRDRDPPASQRLPRAAQHPSAQRLPRGTALRLSLGNLRAGAYSVVRLGPRDPPKFVDVL